MTKKIVFQYFDGCPNSTATLKNLQDLLSAVKIGDYELEIVEVPSPELAQELNFQGSPSVLINGVDIYTEKTPKSYSYSCRIFDIDGEKSGVLPTEYLRKKLIKLGIPISGNT